MTVNQKQSKEDDRQKKSPVYHLVEKAVLEAFDDGALVLNLDNLNLTELNETARDILQLTDGKQTLEQVARKLALQYDIAFPQAEEDVQELYQVLMQQGILEQDEQRTNNPQEG